MRTVRRATKRQAYEIDFLKPNLWDQALIERGIFYDPDIVHVHDLPQLLAGVRIKEALKIPLVYDAHEIYTEIHTLNEGDKRFLYQRERALLPKADIRISTNPFAGEWLRKRYRCKPFDWITNATEPPSDFNGERLWRFHEKLGLPRDRKIVCYQGWFATEGRGLIELIEAMSMVPEGIDLVMLGYGDTQSFFDVAKRAGVLHRVHFVDAVPWRDLIYWSASADLGVIPYQAVDINHVNCCPNKLFEFIAARLPILANDLRFLRHVIAGEGFGHVCQLDTPTNIAAGIRAAFSGDGEMLTRARQNLLAKGANWEWSVEARKLLALYGKVSAVRTRAADR